ncbi:MAG: 7-cyano-7-deazaguanine synthase QueC [Hyphomonadaceae bacterium]
MTAALVLFSAGQDSATCLAWALERFAQVETIGFDYGQRHRIELSQRPIVLGKLRGLRADWAGRLGEDLVVDLQGFGALSDSALTSARAIEMAANGLPSTFVPGRNLMFLTAAAAHAYRRGIDTLVGGMCETDYSGYPDCRRSTLDAMAEALTLGLDAPMRIETPLMHLSKAETWALANEIGGAPLVRLIREDTHTCYEGDRTHAHEWGFGCGACPACTLRAKGYEAWRAGAEAQG